MQSVAQNPTEIILSVGVGDYRLVTATAAARDPQL
jgi:hypothetical protein